MMMIPDAGGRFPAQESEPDPHMQVKVVTGRNCGASGEVCALCCEADRLIHVIRGRSERHRGDNRRLYLWTLS